MCLIQYFEADFLGKVSLKIVNSGLILKTFTHVHNKVNNTVTHKNIQYNKWNLPRCVKLRVSRYTEINSLKVMYNVYCKTFIFGGYFYLGPLAVKTNICKYNYEIVKYSLPVSNK